MKYNYKILFLDVGGVILSNGWDHDLRTKMSERFYFELDEFKIRHAFLFDLFERGRLTFDEYLEGTIFYKERPYSKDEIKKAIFEAAFPYTEMMDYIKGLREEYQIKIAIVSNEGRELALDRVTRFGLRSFVDFFIFSSFVGMRKPDEGIYRMAMEIGSVSPEEIIYLDDRAFLVERAKRLGLKTILHQNYLSTKQELDHLLVR